MKKRILATLLALVIVVGLLPTTATAASTLKASEATTEVERKLAELQTKTNYRPGDKPSFADECMPFAKNVFKQLFGYDTNSLYYNGKLISGANLVRVGRLFVPRNGCTCNVDTSSGVDSTSITTDTVKTLLSKAKCGDIVQILRFNSSPIGCGVARPHTMIVQQIKSDSIVVYEGNYKKDTVGVREITFKNFASDYNHVVTVYRANNYDKVNGGSSSSTPAASTLKIAPTTQPTTLLKGDPFYFKGKITSNYSITSATVTLSDTKGNVLQTKTIHPNTTSVDIATSGLDALKFGVLSAGMYNFRLKAIDQSGYSDEWSTGFLVNEGTGAPISNVSITPDKQVYHLGDTITFTCTHSDGTTISTFAINGANGYFENSRCGTWNGNIFSTTANDLGEFTATIGVTNGRETVNRSCTYQIIAEEPKHEPTTYKVEVQCYLDGELKSTYQIPSEQGSDQEFDLRMDRSDIPSLVVMESGTWDQSYKLFFQNVQSDITAYVYYESDAENEAPPVVEPEPDSYIITFIYEDESGEMLDVDRVEVGSTTEFTLSFESKKPYYEVIRGYSEDFDCGVHKTLFKAKISDIHSNGTVHLVLRPIEQEPEPADKYGNFNRVSTYRSGMFYDVDYTDWFEENVRCAYELGLMKGRGSGAFSPSDYVTIAEVITLAARIHSTYHTGSDSFPTYDGGNWYDPYVNYAWSNNIINTNYNYSDYASREHVAHILARALPDDALQNTAGQISFFDSGDITYKADIRLLSGAGVINGIRENGNLYFRPRYAITRAEVAAIATRMADPSLRN